MNTSPIHHHPPRPSPASTAFRQRPAWPEVFTVFRPARHLRRGNAMIMAVSLTVLLAIIGTSFVLVTRMDRQSVRGVEAAVAADAALENTIAKIQEILSRDVVSVGDGFDDLNGNGVYDPGIDVFDPARHDRNGNGVYDPVFFLDNGGISTPLASREPYDHPSVNDPWLAPIEPSINQDGLPYWSQTSEILQATTSQRPAMPNVGTNVPGDADADGIRDCVLRDLPGQEVNGWKAQVGVRIIDNSGMINGNTVWKRLFGGVDPRLYNLARIPNLSDPTTYGRFDSYGEFLHQIDVYRLLKRSGIADDAWAQAATLHHERTKSSPVFTEYNLDSILYQDLFIRDYGWFGLLPGSNFSPYGLMDELELRNRHSINTPTMTPIERAMEIALGGYDPNDPVGLSTTNNSYRVLPYNMSAGTPQEIARRWYAQITDDRSALLTTADENAVPRAIQRHLFTLYNYDREVRLRDTINPADDQLDKPGSAQFLPGSGTLPVQPGSPGKFRKININTVLRLLVEQGSPGGDPTNPLPAFNAGTTLTQVQADAMRQVALAFTAAGYTWDQGFQFIANLIDYIDADNEPTVFDPALLPANTRPTVRIYGNERQPFIVEVFNSVNDLTKESELAAVELYNPYRDPIVTAGWQLYYNNALLINLDGPAIPPGGSVVYRTSVSVAVAGGVATHEDSTLLFNPPDPNAELMLVRPAANSQLTVLDRVRSDIFGQSPEVTTSFSVWRGLAPLAAPRVVFDQPVAPWSWARSEFSPTTAGASKLGQIDKIVAGDVLLDKPGIPIPIANRGPIPDGSAARWRVNGWYELSRILFVGNPDFQTIQSYASETPPPSEVFTDVNGNGSYDFGEPFTDLNGNGVYDPQPDVRTISEKCTKNRNGQPINHEAEVRLDLRLAPPYINRAARLMDRLSFFSRTDDRMDNENADGDNDPTTHFDSLLECRIPGRVNINTAPKAVLEALFPALTYDDYTGILDENEIEWLSTRFAEAVIYLREPNPVVQPGPGIECRPFQSLADFATRLGAFTNIDNSGSPIVDGLYQDLQGRSLWFGRMIDALKGRPPGTTIVGDPYLNSDAEERDWIFTRMANLLTVRSDTFTAYIQIRLLKGSESMDQHYIAIFDRSNVFLPEEMARNGFPLDAGNMPVPGDDSGEMLIFDPTGAIHGPGAPQEDPNYFDRQYVTPRLVALRQAPDPR